MFEEVTEVFSRLSIPRNNVTNDDMSIIEEFVVIMYDRTSTIKKVNEARFDLFARKQRSYTAIPPTRAALNEHVKRAVLQVDHTWGQALCRTQQLPSPAEWAWKNEHNAWSPYWTSLSLIAAFCQELLKCGCKNSCSGHCKCYRSGLTYTALCSCTCQEGI